MSAARYAAKPTLRLLSPGESAPGGIADQPVADRATGDGTGAVPSSDRSAPAIDGRPSELSARAQRPCRCGHQREAHRHYRSGTDCGTCGCGRFSAARGRLAALAGAILRRRPTAADRP